MQGTRVQSIIFPDNSEQTTAAGAQMVRLNVATTYGPIGSGAAAKVTFDNVQEDTFGYWNVVDNKFAPTKTTKVEVIANIGCQFNSAAGYIEVGIYYYDGGVTFNSNKSKYIDLEGYVSAAPIIILSGSQVMEVLAGDTLEVTVYTSPSAAGAFILGTTSILGGSNVCIKQS